MIKAKPNEAITVVVGMLNDRSGLWQITQPRISILQDAVGHLSLRARTAAEEMLKVAASGERFWQPRVEDYFALNEIKARSMAVDKKTIERVIGEVAACARRDGVAHREWVKNVLDVLTRISNEK